MICLTILLALSSIIGGVNPQIGVEINNQKDEISEQENDFAPQSYLSSDEAKSYYRARMNAGIYFETTYNATNTQLLKDFSIESITGIVPREMDQNDQIFIQAMNDIGRPNDKIGCGLVSAISQFDYFDKVFKYSHFDVRDSNAQFNIDLVSEMVNETSFWFSSSGTGVTTNELTRVMNKTLERHNLTNKLIVSKYNDFHSANVKSRLDKGLPVIWATGIDRSLAGTPYYSHYMNLYGYEEWTYIDGNNNLVNKTMYKLRQNWNFREQFNTLVEDTIIENCGVFIPIQFNSQYITIKPEDYHFSQSYPNSSVGAIVSTSVDSIFTSRLRTGFIVNKYLVMSARRDCADEAYLAYFLNNDIDEIELNFSLWSDREYLDFSNDRLQIEFFCNNQWVMPSIVMLNLLSINRDVYYNYIIHLSGPVTAFRIHLKSSKVGNVNKGRVCIGDVRINMPYMQ